MFNKNIVAVVAVIAMLALGGWALFRTPAVTAPAGSVTGPDSYFPVETHDGVGFAFVSGDLNQASTTICSMKSPSATSTLLMGSVKLTTGTTTTIALEFGKSTVFDATTTRISYVSSLASAGRITLTAFVASTTGVYGALSQQHTADEQDMVFAPNTFLNAKYGGPLGITNVFVGSCKAIWLIN